MKLWKVVNILELVIFVVGILFCSLEKSMVAELSIQQIIKWFL